MRPTRAIVSIAFIAVLTVGTVLVSAEPGERGVKASEHPAGGFEHGRAFRPRTTSPVGVTTTAAVTAPTTSPVRPLTTSPVVLATAPGVVRRLSPAVFSDLVPISLGMAGTFAILTKTGITNVYASRVTGNVGASPITGASVFLTCTEVTGTIFSVNAAGPLPCRKTDAPGLTTAVRDEEAAYTDAAGRTNPDSVGLGAGQVGGMALAPGLYKWTGSVSISRDVTLVGGPNDVWIF